MSRFNSSASKWAGSERTGETTGVSSANAGADGAEIRGPGSVTIVVEHISPQPSDAEAAAIALALNEVWPKPQQPSKVSEEWRFSGRPWFYRASRFRA